MIGRFMVEDEVLIKLGIYKSMSLANWKFLGKFHAKLAKLIRKGIAKPFLSLVSAHFARFLLRPLRETLDEKQKTNFLPLLHELAGLHNI
jgi:hypothetical protein